MAKIERSIEHGFELYVFLECQLLAQSRRNHVRRSRGRCSAERCILVVVGSDSRSGSDKRTGSSRLQRFLPFARARFDFTLAVVVHSYGMHAGNIRNRGHERDPSIRRLNIVERQPHTSAPGLMRGFDFVHVAANLGAWRERGPVRADCSSLVPTLIESEPFGYVKGAFTGAVHAKMDDGIGRQ